MEIKWIFPGYYFWEVANFCWGRRPPKICPQESLITIYIFLAMFLSAVVNPGARSLVSVP